MDPTSFDETHIRQAASAVGLAVTSADMPGVILYFQMLAGFAEIVDEFALDEAIEHAAVFTPCSPTTPA